MNWPQSEKQLAAAGYHATGKSKWCACGRIVTWFTTPNGHWIPLEAAADGHFEPHHATCKDVKNFRSTPRHPAAQATRSTQEKLPL